MSDRLGMTGNQVGYGNRALGLAIYNMPEVEISKVDTTMSDGDAKRLSTKYDTRGPLPKGMSRDQKMEAYEARYIASGGKKAEKWKRRGELAEVGRNAGLAGATGLGALSLIARHPRVAAKAPKLHRTSDTGAIGSAVVGGAHELYGEHARSKQASYRNSPGGVAASALSRMQAYTPEKKR